ASLKSVRELPNKPFTYSTVLIPNSSLALAAKSRCVNLPSRMERCNDHSARESSILPAGPGWASVRGCNMTALPASNDFFKKSLRCDMVMGLVRNIHRNIGIDKIDAGGQFHWLTGFV